MNKENEIIKTRKYLQKLRLLDTRINQKIKELDTLRLKTRSVNSIDFSQEKVKKKVSDAYFAKIIRQIADFEKEINTELDRFIYEKHKIINQIQALDNDLYVSILFKRYIEFKNFKVISKEISYTYDYTGVLHKKALNAFAKIHEKSI